MHSLADDPSVVQRILDHIDNRTTDRGAGVWHEAVENYRSETRFAAEIAQVLRRTPTPFCPSAALPDAGSYVARNAAGVPLIAVRDRDGVVRVFRNACRHRGMQLADGTGCKRVLVCPYHAWTYDLDGRLRGVPHEDGFPGLDKRSHGLVAVASFEDQGLVWVTQEGPAPAKSPWAELAGLVPSAQRLVGTSRAGAGGQLEDRRRRLSRGLPPAGAARRHLLPDPVRQPQRHRAVRPEQPGDVSVPPREQVARCAAEDARPTAC